MKLQFLTLETIRGMDKSFRRDDLWDCLGGGGGGPPINIFG